MRNASDATNRKGVEELWDEKGEEEANENKGESFYIDQGWKFRKTKI